MSNRYEHLHYCEYRDTETGLIASNYVDVMNEQDQKIKDLEAKLAESEEAIKYLKGIKRYDIGELLTENIRLKQSQDQTAIAELEKVQKYISDNAVGAEQECFAREINDYIDQQIKSLKGESR